MKALEVHSHVAGRWPEILATLGVDAVHLRKKKQGPCPMCGGRDRFCFDDRAQRGDYICRGCGAGVDGFDLLQRLYRWDFKTTSG